MENDKYIISHSILSALLEYLSKKPYFEVEQVMPILTSLPKFVERTVEEDDA